MRLDRYGRDYRSRIQGEREKLFDQYLYKSVYRVDFTYNKRIIEATLEPMRQNETKTMAYLLTRVNEHIPNGTVLMIPDKDRLEKPWMIYYLETMEASGYNRYIVLEMTHYLTWEGRDGSMHSSWAYMYGQENNMLKDEIRSRSRMDTIYAENLKLSFFVMPKNEYIRKDVYLIISEKPFQEYYRVTGYDLQSTDGVEYVSVDPVYEFDQTPPPEKETGDDDSDFFWFKGGQE